MLTFDWRFGPAMTQSVNGLDDVIMEIQWICLGTDTETGAVYKTTGHVVVPPVNPDKFIPFESMSRQSVASLVYSQLDRTTVENLLTTESQTVPTRSVKGFNFP